MQGLLVDIINQRKANILAGFSHVGTTSPEASNDTLQKGEIMNQFGYGYGNGNKPLTFGKTGKWIKENLPLVAAKLEILKATLQAQMTECIKLAGEDPTEPHGSYQLKEIQLLRYDYNMCYPKQEVSLSNQPTASTDANKACQLYNDLSYKMINVLEDLACIKVVVNNAEDKKTYDLTISQFVALGLQDAITKGEITVAKDEDALEKSELLNVMEDNIEKGEGSRGGKIIGHTKSGKPIYLDGSKTDGYDHQDHHEAFEHHAAISDNSRTFKKHYGKQDKKEATDTREIHMEISRQHNIKSREGMKEGDKRTLTNDDGSKTEYTHNGKTIDARVSRVGATKSK